jgi:hypothetical protein
MRDTVLGETPLALATIFKVTLAAWAPDFEEALRAFRVTVMAEVEKVLRHCDTQSEIIANVGLPADPLYGSELLLIVRRGICQPSNSIFENDFKKVFANTGR